MSREDEIRALLSGSAGGPIQPAVRDDLAYLLDRVAELERQPLAEQRVGRVATWVSSVPMPEPTPAQRISRMAAVLRETYPEDEDLELLLGRLEELEAQRAAVVAELRMRAAEYQGSTTDPHSDSSACREAERALRAAANLVERGTP